MKNIKRFLFAAILLSFLSPHNLWASQENLFVCGGEVEKAVWSLWDTNVRTYLQQKQIHDRLLKQGDVYALYDIQTYTHNMVSMARRCKRTDKLRELAEILKTAYTALENGDAASPGRRWVCRGGSVCNEKNRLINTEVMLCSVQFLGLATYVANALSLSGMELTDEDKRFIKETVHIAVEHLLRWGDDKAIASIQKVMKATPQDVKDGSSSLFFTDKPLWLITVYAELAGILTPSNKDAAPINEYTKRQMSRHIQALLQFFLSRVSMYKKQESRRGDVNCADIDRGYWRLYFDNRYAGYEGDLKPVACKKDNGKGYNIETQVPPETIQKREDTGWDISHARRLVHALDALERNHKALKDTFSLDDKNLFPADLTESFANTLIAVIWNGDLNKPLFSNYWSGANGWYRVAYDIGTGQCREGTPPYGLTNSFPTGGYITWVRHNPVIGNLGKRLYEMSKSNDLGDSLFMKKYYPGLHSSDKTQSGILQKFMFYPSIVVY